MNRPAESPQRTPRQPRSPRIPREAMPPIEHWKRERGFQIDRVHTMIDALTLVSDDSIETTIDVMEVILEGKQNIARLARLALNGGKPRGITLGRYSSRPNPVAKSNPHKVDEYKITETTTGWVLPDFFGSNKGITPSKRVASVHRGGDLIIAKPSAPGGPYRSWKGGQVAYHGGPRHMQNRPDKIGVGNGKLSYLAWGNDVIGRIAEITPTSASQDMDVQVSNLVAIGDALFNLGLELGKDSGFQESVPVDMLPEGFRRRPVTPATPAA